MFRLELPPRLVAGKERVTCPTETNKIGATFFQQNFKKRGQIKLRTEAKRGAFAVEWTGQVRQIRRMGLVALPPKRPPRQAGRGGGRMMRLGGPPQEDSAGLPFVSQCASGHFGHRLLATSQCPTTSYITEVRFAPH
jgi:hypothetical protein